MKPIVEIFVSSFLDYFFWILIKLTLTSRKRMNASFDCIKKDDFPGFLNILNKRKIGHHDFVNIAKKIVCHGKLDFFKALIVNSPKDVQEEICRNTLTDDHESFWLEIFRERLFPDDYCIKKILGRGILKYLKYYSEVLGYDLNRCVSLCGIFGKCKDYILDRLLEMGSMTRDSIKVYYEHGHLPDIKKMISHGIDIKEFVQEIYMDDFETLEYLRLSGYDFGNMLRTVSGIYICNGNLDLLRELLKGKEFILNKESLMRVYDVNIFEYITSMGVTCDDDVIMEYIHDKKMNLVKMLHEKGYDLTKDRFILYCPWNFVGYLLSIGADARVNDDLLLFTSISDGKYDITKLLISYGCKLAGRNNLKDYLYEHCLDEMPKWLLEFCVSEGLNINKMHFSFEDDDAERYALDHGWYNKEIKHEKYIAYLHESEEMPEDILKVIKKRNQRRRIMYTQYKTVDIVIRAIFP